jgi:hypothetical protein
MKLLVGLCESHYQLSCNLFCSYRPRYNLITDVGIFPNLSWSLLVGCSVIFILLYLQSAAYHPFLLCLQQLPPSIHALAPLHKKKIYYWIISCSLIFTHLSHLILCLWLWMWLIGGINFSLLHSLPGLLVLVFFSSQRKEFTSSSTICTRLLSLAARMHDGI